MAPNPSKFKAPILTPTSSAGSSQNSVNGSQNNSENKRGNDESSTSPVKSSKPKKQKKISVTTSSREQETSVKKSTEKPKKSTVPLTNEEYDLIFKAAIGDVQTEAIDTLALLKDSEDMFSLSQSDLEELEEDEDDSKDAQEKENGSEKVQSSSAQVVTAGLSFGVEDIDQDSENRDPKNSANMRAVDGTEEEEDVIPSSQVILPLKKVSTSRKPLTPIQNSDSTMTMTDGDNVPKEPLFCDLSEIKIEPSPSITYMAEWPPSNQSLNGSQQTEMVTHSTSQASGTVPTSSSSFKASTKKSSQICKESASQKSNSSSQSLKPAVTLAASAVPSGSQSNKKKIGVPSALKSSQGSSTHSQPLSQLADQATGSQPASQNLSQRLNLSQPPPKLSRRERLQWLQERRAVGLWVQCDHKTCGKWRQLPDIHDPTILTEKWYCSMHPDENFNTCAAPEKRFSILQEEDMIFNAYTAGSLVWARLSGYPWWPAMVDDDPDIEQFYWLNEFSDIPTWYNVVFLDENRKVLRAWIETENLRPFKGPEDEKFFMLQVHRSDYKKRIEGGCRIACDMQKYDILERLRRYSFISRYKGPIGSKQSRKERRVEDDDNTHHCNLKALESVSQGAESK